MFQKIISDYKATFSNVEKELNAELASYSSGSTQKEMEMDAHIKRLIRKIEVEIAAQTNILVRLKHADINMEAAVAASSDLLNGRAQEILNEQISIALMKNVEFSAPQYSSRLYGAVMTSPNLIRIELNKKDIIASQVIIDANSVFGKISEWARAVEKIRKEVNKESEGRKEASVTNKNSKMPDSFVGSKAPHWLESHFFYEKFYRVAMLGGEIWTSGGKGEVRNPKRRPDKEQLYKDLYFQTIERRLAICKDPAPFWELLDKGSVAYPKGNNVGVIQHAKTNFIYFAKSEIKRTFLDNYLDIRSVYEAEKADLIVKINAYISELQRGVDYLYTLLKVEADKFVSAPEKLTKIYEWENKVSVAERLADKYKVKLADVEVALLNLDRDYFGKDIRVSLGSIGGKRVRPRLAQVFKDIQEMNNMQ